MHVNGELIIGLITAIVLTAGVIWRFETRIAGVDARISNVETRLGDRISALSDWVSRIEGLLEGYFSQSGKTEDKHAVRALAVRGDSALGLHPRPRNPAFDDPAGLC